MQLDFTTEHFHQIIMLKIIIKKDSILYGEFKAEVKKIKNLNVFHWINREQT